MPPQTFVCNTKAIRAEQRPRYNELVGKLRSAIRRRTEIATGYVYSMDPSLASFTEAAEWVELERLCCPFLTLQLTASGKAGWLLTLTGPPGVKPLLNEEFPFESPK